MCHSVLLFEEMIAILSFFSTPKCNKALDKALALLIYSCVDVLTQSEPKAKCINWITSPLTPDPKSLNNLLSLYTEKDLLAD